MRPVLWCLLLITLSAQSRGMTSEGRVKHYMNQNGTAEFHMFEAELNQRGELSSPNFHFCCKNAFYTIKCLKEAGRPCYIRLLFTDLDLPKGSVLHVYDGENAQARMFPEQPELKRGAWFRPAIASSGDSIHLQFVPKKLREKSRTGFKAEFWVISAPPEHWHEKPTTEGCGLVKSTTDGKSVRLVLPHHFNLGLHTQDQITQDCVWSLPVPTFPPQMQAYARFTQLEMYGYLEVREGPTSEGSILFGGDFDTHSLNSKAWAALQSEQKVMGFNSSKGLYIRVEVQNSKEEPNELSFVYGVFMEAEPKGDECQFLTEKGILCNPGAYRWCLPKEDRCNDVDNCPDGADETDICSMMDPDIVLEVPSACGNQKQCADGTCATEGRCPEDTCPLTRPYKCRDNSVCLAVKQRCDNHGDCADKSDELDCDMCGTEEKKCANHTCVFYQDRCPEDVCPIIHPFRCQNGDCYPPDYRCDGECDCVECDDEHECQEGVTQEMWVYCFVVVPLIVMVLVLYIGCNKMQKMWIKEQQNEKLRASIRHARSLSGNSHTSSRCSHHHRLSPRASNTSANYQSLAVVRESSRENGEQSPPCYDANNPAPPMIVIN